MSSKNNKTASSSTETMDTIWKSLKSWVEKDEKGNIHPSITLKLLGEEGEERGLFASKQISKGEVLIKLPSRLAISGEKLPSKFQNKKKGDKQQRNASPWLRCLACLYLAQDDSDWEPYTASLPSSYETLLSWTDEEAAFLAGTTLGESLLADRTEKATQNRYEEYVKPYLKFLKIPSAKSDDNPIELFEKISMCLSTRGFHMQPPEDEEDDNQKPSANSTAGPYLGPFLLPVIDLLNHATGSTLKSTTLQRDPKTNDFYMIAERDIAAGEEICHSYGSQLTSSQLLQTFGFVVVPDKGGSSGVAAAAAANSNNNNTPAIFSKEKLVEACALVKQSTYPKELQQTMEECDIEGETFDLPSSTKKRDLTFLPDQYLVGGNDDDNAQSLISDEMVTLCCTQMLPDEMYEEIEQDMLSTEILDDYYLGKLVGMALLKAIQSKLDTYTKLKLPKDLIEANDGDDDDDKTLLQKLQQQSSTTKGRQRAMYALTIRLEEKSSLEALKKEVLTLIASLDDNDGEDGEDDDEGDAIQELLRQRMMEKGPPNKKHKKSSE